MHRDLLLRLADGLEKDAAKPDGIKFDLGTWAGPSDQPYGYWPMGEPPVEPVPVSCGTTACALGFAAISGLFKAEGLKYEFCDVSTFGKDRLLLEPSFYGHTGFNAGAYLFDITMDDSRYLFDPDCYDGTPREAEGELLVAARIRAFADGKIDRHYHLAALEEDDWNSPSWADDEEDRE
jgi:hypothetical protein